MRGYLLIALAFFGLTAPVAWAKSVHIEWQPVNLAIAYELRIERHGKAVLKKRLTKVSWHGDLKYGYYRYQIRAIDWVNRPGQWSEPQSLAVMPRAPRIDAPDDGDTLKNYWVDTQIEIKWSRTEEGIPYRVEIRRGDSVIFRNTLVGTQVQVKSIEPGSYRAQVRPVIQADGIAKEWEGPASSEVHFVVERTPLQKPRLVSPVDDKLRPPSDEKIELKWKRVEGATGYYVKLQKEGTPAKAVNPVAPPLFTRETSMTFPIKEEGNYRWEVLATAYPKASEKTRPGTADQDARAESRFVVSKPPREKARHGTLDLGLFRYSYDYNAQDQIRNIQANLQWDSSTGKTPSPRSDGVHLGARYSPWEKWSIGSDIEMREITLDGLSTALFRQDFLLRRRFLLFAGLGITPAIGLDFRNFAEVVGNIQSTNGPFTVANPYYLKAWALGAKFGFELFYEFGESWLLSVQMLSSQSLLRIGGNTSDRMDPSSNSFSPGLNLTYWFMPRWGIELSLLGDMSDIKLRSGGATDQIHFDGTQYMARFIHEFQW